MSHRMFEGLMKGLLETAEASVRVMTTPSWTDEEKAQGRPMDEMLRTAANGLADTLAAVLAAAPAMEADKAHDEAAARVLEGRLRDLEVDRDELAEHIDRLEVARAPKGPRRPRSLDEPLPHHLVDVYRVVTQHLFIHGATPDQIRECILADARPRDPVPGAAGARRLILKARRLCGQAEVEAVREVIATPAVFSVLYGCLAPEHRQQTREDFDA